MLPFHCRWFLLYVCSMAFGPLSPTCCARWDSYTTPTACTRMISAWDTVFEVDDYYTYKKPVGHGAYGVVISALDTRDNSKVRTKEREKNDNVFFFIYVLTVGVMCGRAMRSGISHLFVWSLRLFLKPANRFVAYTSRVVFFCPGVSLVKSLVRDRKLLC